MRQEIRRSAEIGQAFQSFITTLEKNQVEYDLGSENIIKDMGSVKNGKFIAGQCSYSTVVIPPMMENLDLETYKLLERFVSNGGRLVAFSLPSLVDGAPSEGLNEFLKERPAGSFMEQNLTPEIIRKYFADRYQLFRSGRRRSLSSPEESGRRATAFPGKFKPYGISQWFSEDQRCRCHRNEYYDR